MKHLLLLFFVGSTLNAFPGQTFYDEEVSGQEKTNEVCECWQQPEEDATFASYPSSGVGIESPDIDEKPQSPSEDSLEPLPA